MSRRTPAHQLIGGPGRRSSRVVGRLHLPGQVRQDLMRNARDPREFTIVSEWTDRAALDRFARRPGRG